LRVIPQPSARLRARARRLARQLRSHARALGRGEYAARSAAAAGALLRATVIATNDRDLARAIQRTREWFAGALDRHRRAGTA
jgi:hypothetical protein